MTASLILRDRVKESTSSIGLTAFLLAGAPTGADPFSTIGDGNLTYYEAYDAATGSRETGKGTYVAAGNQLQRTQVLASSNGNAAVDFLNPPLVWITFPAALANAVVGTAANNVLLSAVNAAPAWSAYKLPSVVGSAGNVLRSNGADYLSAALAASDLSNGVTGTGAVVLASASTLSSLTSIGTIATGVWNATKIGLAYGGTNADLSATGGTSQVLRQSTSGGAVSVSQLAATDLSNGVTGTGAVVLATVSTLSSLTTVGTLASPAMSGQALISGATTTSPGFYAQVSGDTVPRVRVGLNATDVASVAFGGGAGSRDLFLERAAAANLRFGGPDAAAPVAQVISFQNVVASTANTAGALATFKDSAGTGTGVSGGYAWQVAAAGTTGSTQNTWATAMSLTGAGVFTVSTVAINANIITTLGACRAFIAAPTTLDNLALIGYTNDTHNVALDFMKTRSASTDASVSVNSNDIIGGIWFYGANGTAYQPAGWMRWVVDGVPSSSSMPGKLQIAMTPAGSNLPVVILNIANTGLATFTDSVAAAAFIPSGSSVPTNGLYLPGSNNPAISANSTLVASFTSTCATLGGVNATAGLPLVKITDAASATMRFSMNSTTSFFAVNNANLSIGLQTTDGGTVTAPLQLNSLTTTPFVQITGAAANTALIVTDGVNASFRFSMVASGNLACITSGTGQPIVFGLQTSNGGAVTEYARVTSVGVTALAFVPTGSSVPANGLYLPVSNNPAISANGTLVASFAAGTVAVAGIIRPDTNSTRDLGQFNNVWRIYYGDVHWMLYGTAGSPSYDFQDGIGNNQGTGLFYVSSGTLGFATSGTEKMRLTGAGFLGIGLSPTAQLNVGGNISAAAWTTSGIALVTAAATYTDNTSATGTVAAVYINRLGVGTIAATNTSVVYTNAYGLWVEPPAAGTNVTLTNKWAAGFNGNISVVGTTVAAAFIPSGSSAPTNGMYLNTTNSIAFATNSVARMAINANGTMTLGFSNLSASAWTTTGIGLIVASLQYTDTSSSGTVAAVYMNRIGQPSVLASSATTYTSAYTLFIDAPVASTNVTFSSRFALGLGSGLTAVGSLISTASTPPVSGIGPTAAIYINSSEGFLAAYNYTAAAYVNLHLYGATIDFNNGSGIIASLSATGAFTSSSHIPSGSTVPTNGLYLPATNNPAIAVNSVKVVDFTTVGMDVFGASLGSASTASFLSVTGTWNDLGTAFKGALLVNVTNTASNAGSLLADFQVGGSSKLRIDKAGNVLGAAVSSFQMTFLQFQDGSAVAKSYMQSVTDGTIVLLNNAGNSFTSLQFGGATSSFPALLRIGGPGLRVILADNSSSGAMQAANFEVVSGSLVPTNGMYLSGTNTIAFTTNNLLALSINGSQLATFVGAVTMSHYGAGAATFDSSGNISSVSDERIKTNVIPFARGVAALRGTRPMLYQHTVDSGLDTTGTYAGYVINDEFSNALPEAVFSPKSPDGYRSLWDRAILATVHNVVLSHEDRIAQLEQEVHELRERLAA